MTFTVKIEGNIRNAMRQAGYYLEKEENGELAFLRPVGFSGSGYPRFHIYLKFNNVSRETSINLHLDQKKPVYKGVSAHAGEYRGAVVQKEVERIKQILR